MRKAILFCITILGMLLVGCSQNKEKGIPLVEKKLFGKLQDGREIDEYTLKNANGMEAKIINYGARIVSLTAPDKNGIFADVVLGFDNLEGYIADKSFFGAIVGRYGNRINKGRFKLEGKEYQLSRNNGENHLHGGTGGFFNRVWNVVNSDTLGSNWNASIILKYISKDGEEGYPGNVEISVRYSLTKDNELSINYSATSDKKTIMNPTNHSYFNLSGDMKKTILDQELMLDADTFTPVDKGLITTGIFQPVTNTPMDFRTPKKIGADITADYEQLKLAGGYDHNWVLNKHKEKIFKFASVYESTSGRLMEVWTDQPGCQFYSGNFLDGTITGKNGLKYGYRTGFCMEPQLYPDSPNKPDWPSPVLDPGKVYRQTTIYKFSAK
jgi:aldose 1-epimerase